MKKISLLIMTLFLSSFILACGNNPEEKTEREPEIEENTKKESETEVEENEKNEIEEDAAEVEITIPALLVEDNLEDLTKDAKEAGVNEVIENEDGSLTYRMSKSVHQELLQEYEEGIDELITEFEENEELASIQEIKANDSLTQFIMVVNREQFEEGFDGFVAFSFALSALYYQAFKGIDFEDYHVDVKLEDADTGETFDQFDILEELEELEEFEDQE